MSLLRLWAALVFIRGYWAGRRGRPIAPMPYPPNDWRVQLWVTGWLRARMPSLFDPSLYFGRKR